MKSYDVGGIKLPSVTSIVNSKNINFFKYWRSNNKEKSEFQLARGKQVHYLIEQYLSSGYDNNEEEFYYIFERFKDLILDELDLFSEFHLELPLTSLALGYGGTIDCLAKYKDNYYIIDWKTTSKKRTRSNLKSYVLQLAAYKQLLDTEFVNSNNVRRFPDVRCMLVLGSTNRDLDESCIIELNNEEIAFARAEFTSILREYKPNNYK